MLWLKIHVDTAKLSITRQWHLNLSTLRLPVITVALHSPSSAFIFTFSQPVHGNADLIYHLSKKQTPMKSTLKIWTPITEWNAWSSKVNCSFRIDLLKIYFHKLKISLLLHPWKFSGPALSNQLWYMDNFSTCTWECLSQLPSQQATFLLEKHLWWLVSFQSLQTNFHKK